MEISYHCADEQSVEVEVRTPFRFTETLEILREPWEFRLKRSCPTAYMGCLEQLQWQLPDDCPVSIVLDPPPPLRPVEFDWSDKPIETGGTYGVSAYSTGGDKENEADQILHGYDFCFLPRKPWKVKSQRHAIHLLASMGVCRAKV